MTANPERSTDRLDANRTEDISDAEALFEFLDRLFVLRSRCSHTVTEGCRCAL